MTTGCLFCGGDASEPGHFTTCDGRQGAYEASLPEPATQTTGEAFALLEATRTRFIAQAREVAAERCQAVGETHASDVRAVMAARGLLSSLVRDHWLGCVFRRSQFEWTGQWFLPDAATYPRHGAHAFRPVKVWRLKVS